MDVLSIYTRRETVNNFFEKINMSFDDFTFESECGPEHHNYDNGSVKLTYYSGTHKDIWYSAYNQDIFTIKPDVMSLADIHGEGFLNPHRDHNVTVSLNYYFEADVCATKFYTLKEEFKDLKFKKNIFKLEELDYVGEFVAKSGEAFLLNVNEIHAVDFPAGSKRKMVNFQWRTKTFQEILESIKC